jgi:hypothetical protein
MRNKSTALNIRHQFAVRRNVCRNFGRLWMANSVTLAKRVRIDILKALLKQVVDSDELAYFNAYATRPVIIIKHKVINIKSEMVEMAGTYDENVNDDSVGLKYILIKGDEWMEINKITTKELQRTLKVAKKNICTRF